MVGRGAEKWHNVRLGGVAVAQRAARPLPTAANLPPVGWVILLDVLVVLAGLAGLGLAAWRLVVRPGLRLGRAFSDLAEQAARATDALSAANARGGVPGSEGSTRPAGAGPARTLSR